MVNGPITGAGSTMPTGELDTGLNIETADTQQIDTDLEVVEPEAPITTEPVIEETKTVESVTPVIEEPVVEEPTQVAEPVVAPTPIPVVEPTPVVTPTVEPTRMDQISQEVAEIDLTKRREDVDVARKDKVINDFNKMLQEGANLEDLRDFAIANKEFRREFSIAVKNRFKNRDNLAFVRKYSNATNDELKSAVESGDVVIGSQQYNLLPEETKRRFDVFTKLQNASGKKDFSMDNAKVISLQDFTEQLQGFFSFDLREKMEAQKNDPRLAKTRSDLENLQNDISDVDASLEAIEDDIRAEFSKSPISVQNALIAKAQKDLIRQKNSIVNQYNAKLGTYKDMKDDLNQELQIAQFEDSQNKQLFQTALKLYETNRQEMRQDQLIQLEAEAKTKAEERQFQNQKDLALFKKQLQDETVGGKWQTFPDGLYWLRDDGTTSKVLSGEEIGISQKDNLAAKEYRNEDGSITVAITDLDTGEVNVSTKDIFGNIVYPGGQTETGNDLRNLQGQFPGQAWAKNNNSAGITWQAASDQLKAEWAEAGVAFSQGTARPTAEGGNYVSFPTIQDGLAAHAITLGRKQSSIVNALASWVGTTDKTTNIAYAQDIYNASGVKVPITTPMNQLSSEDLYAILKEQVKRESPGLYSTMRQRGWIGDTSFNLPVISKEVVNPEIVARLDKEQFSQHKAIVGDFTSDAEVKSFETALIEGKNLIASLSQDNGVGDMSAIFQFMKSLDPTSVVRESEFEAAANTAGVATKASVLFNKVASGDKLSESQRRDFKRTALQFLKNRADSYNRKYDESQAFYQVQIGNTTFFPSRASDELNELLRGEVKDAADIVLERSGFTSNRIDDGVLNNIFAGGNL